MQFKQSTPHVAALILIGSLTTGPLVAPGTVGFQKKHLLASAPRVAIVATQPGQTLVRWGKFASEFTPRDSDMPAILQPIACAKYGADVAVFTFDNLAHHIEDALELRFSHGHICRASTATVESPVHLQRGPVTLEDARLKFDFEIASGKPYVGVRLVLPFGS